MNERLRNVLNHPASIPSVVGIVSFGAGVGLGYFLARRRKGDLHVVPKMNFEELSEKVEAFLDEHEEPNHNAELVVPAEEMEIDPKVRDFVEEQLKQKPEDQEPMEELPQSTLGNETAMLKPIIAQEPEDYIYDGDVQPKNVFANNGDGDWDYELEQRQRSDTEPYILHKDEFFADEKDYTQMTLTYYAGDDILVDEDDKPVYNHKNIVGKLNFGHGSGDPSVCYVRNDKNKAEYEILRHEGLYSVEVLGLEIENKRRARDNRHSEHTKFKME